jgi:6-phosphogluconolactonase (cycloisomerase 2 family)
MRRIAGIVAGAFVMACVAAGPALASVSAVAGSPFATGGSQPVSVAFDPSGGVLAVEDSVVDSNPRGIATFTVNSTTGVLTAASGSPAPVNFGLIPGHLAFDPEGTELVTAAPAAVAGGNIVAFAVDPTTGQLSDELMGFGGSVGDGLVANYTVSFRSDGLIAVGGQDDAGYPAPIELAQFDQPLDSLSVFPAITVPDGLNSDIQSVAFSPTQPILATADFAHRYIGVYDVDATDGTVTAIAGSPFTTATNRPVSLAFNPAGTVLEVAMLSGAVYTYEVDPSTGALTAAPGSPVTAGSSASSLAFGHNLLAVASSTAGSVVLYAVDQTTGALTQVGETPASSDLGAIALSSNDRFLAATNPTSGKVSVYTTGFSYPGPIVVGAPTFQTSAGEPLDVPATSGLLSHGAGSAPPSTETLTVLPAQATTAHGTVTVNADGSFLYTPTGGFTGTDHFSFTLTDGHSGYATATAAVNVAGAVISSPSTLVLGSEAVATTGPVAWTTVTNVGNAPLYFSGPASIGGANAADFSIPSGDDLCNGATVAAGATCQIGVRFTPSTTAAESAALSLGANDALSASQPIALSGTGTAVLSTLIPPVALTQLASTPDPASKPPPAATTPDDILPIRCVLRSSRKHILVRCTLKNSTAATLARIKVKQNGKLVASGSAHISHLQITASLPARRALSRKAHPTVTISIGATTPTVVQAATR